MKSRCSNSLLQLLTMPAYYQLLLCLIFATVHRDMLEVRHSHETLR
jgi:hypothetical protein